MIIWVDEDERTTYPTRLLLRRMGHDTIPIPNATLGRDRILEHLNADAGLSLAIVDVMLLQGTDLETFSDQRTENGVLTGLTLIEELIQLRPDIDWAKKIIVFSRASDATIVQRIENTCKGLGLKYVRKDRTFRARGFTKWLKDNGYL